MSDQQRIRVLVISEDAAAKRAVIEYLSGSNEFQLVGTVSNGDGGLVQAVRLVPDVILVDSKLDMSCIDMVMSLKETIPTRKCIPMSVAVDPEWMRNLMNVGVRMFLNKPLVKDELISSMQFVSKK